MFQSARTALALLAAAAMIFGLAQPVAADTLQHVHFLRGSATTTPGSVCVDSYVEPALGVVAVRLDVALNGSVRDSVTSKLASSKRGFWTDSIKYSRCFDVDPGPTVVTAVATVDPGHTVGRPVTVPVLEQVLEVAEAPRPTAPAAPKKPSVQAAGANAIKVGWGEVHDGGSRVTAYEVRISQGGALIRSVDTTATSVTVPRLKARSAYTVTVRARNAVGSSPASPAAGIKLQVPAAPAKPAAAATSATSVRVAWTTPKSTGGPATTGYEIRVYRGSRMVTSLTVAADKRSAHVSGLDGSTRYRVDLRAKNAVGSSPSSAKSAFTTKGWSAAAKWAAKQYGTFPTVTVSGTGNEVILLPRGARAGLITARHSGPADFSVKVQDKDRTTIDWAVNAAGAYSGTTLFGMDSWRGTPRQLEIRASGEWTVQISAVRTAAGLPGSGRGDAVHLYGGPPRRIRLTHDGGRNFSVFTYGSGRNGRDHLVNAVGAYRGTGMLKQGPAVVQVVADGSWTAKLG
jgi:hypothetical protein